MSGPTIARNYGEVSSLIKAHQNSLFEVNDNGSIRTQNLGEKLSNLGARIFGKFEARRAEKDARVKEAIIQLYNKTNPSADSVYAPQKDRILDRFFNPTALPDRKSALKDHKSTTKTVFVAANNGSSETNHTVAAHKELYEGLAFTLRNLSTLPEFRNESEQIDILARVVQDNAKEVTEGNAQAKLQKLKEDLQPLGLALGRGRLEDYNISKGVVAWAKAALPNKFD